MSNTEQLPLPFAKEGRPTNQVSKATPEKQQLETPSFETLNDDICATLKKLEDIRDNTVFQNTVRYEEWERFNIKDARLTDNGPATSLDWAIAWAEQGLSKLDTIATMHQGSPKSPILDIMRTAGIIHWMSPSKDPTDPQCAMDYDEPTRIDQHSRLGRTVIERAIQDLRSFSDDPRISESAIESLERLNTQGKMMTTLLRCQQTAIGHQR